MNTVSVRFLPLALSAVALLAGCRTPARVSVPAGTPSFAVQPLRETAPGRVAESDADDVAFWRHASAPAKNLVFATQKLGGLSVYDVEGRTLLDALPGEVRYNNVDVVQGIPWAAGQIDLAVFSDRIGDTLHAYEVLPGAPYLRRIENLDASARLFGGAPGEDTAYGLALWRDARDGVLYAFVTQNDARRVRQFQLREQDGALAIELVRTFDFELGAPDAHAEGLLLDPATRRLFIAQEDVGLYAVELDKLAPATVAAPGRVVLRADELWQSVALPFLAADVEGIALLPTGETSGYVVASSQGSNSYACYDRQTLALAGVFRVVASPTIDGGEETDGLDITIAPWGPAFPHGVVIVHDGRDKPTGATNFKWIDAAEVLRGLMRR
ncbi:MAG: phytase [Burkholderiales bacterium]|nr:phytase [Opitutaceae bacterium]